MAQEIVPWARVNYHATDRPEQTIIGGASAGGLQAAFVGLKHAEVFGNVLSQSGSFPWKPDGEKEYEWLNRQFAASPRLPLRFSFEAGLLEGTWWWRSLVPASPNGPPVIDPTLLAANRNLRDTLLSKGYSVHYTEFNGNHTLFNWRGTLASHLIALVGIKPAPKISKRERTPTARSLIPKKAIAISQVKVAPAVMRQYVGRYELDPKFAHDFVIYVSVKDDSLWVKPSYLRQRPVIAESNSGFRDSEIPDLHLAFVKDEKGNVTGLTLNSGQGDILVKKLPPPVPSLTGNTTFTLPGHTDAQVVAIYGSFNNWIQTKNYCAREGDGWVCRIDLVPGKYTYASPAINVTDLINNAADKIFGVALDKTGKTLGIHGAESYFAAVSQPFTQRLQGKKSTFDKGAGIRLFKKIGDHVEQGEPLYRVYTFDQPECDLAIGGRLGVPRRQGPDVVGRDREAVLVTQEVLK